MKKEKKSNQKRGGWKIFLLSFFIVFATAFIGSLFNYQQDNAWYDSIKPSITPPDFIFPIVWSILFFFIAISLYLSLKYAEDKILGLKVKIVFVINFILNILWSFFFFFLKKPLFAYLDLLFLWGSIIALIIITWKINKIASILLIPYLLWVSFAGILNYLIAFG